MSGLPRELYEWTPRCVVCQQTGVLCECVVGCVVWVCCEVCCVSVL